MYIIRYLKRFTSSLGISWPRVESHREGREALRAGIKHWFCPFVGFLGNKITWIPLNASQKLPYIFPASFLSFNIQVNRLVLQPGGIVFWANLWVIWKKIENPCYYRLFGLLVWSPSGIMLPFQPTFSLYLLNVTPFCICCIIWYYLQTGNVLNFTPTALRLWVATIWPFIQGPKGPPEHIQQVCYSPYNTGSEHRMTASGNTSTSGI